jgi:phospholipid/cholesterol/gamma-HCH transport system permease protein
MFDRQAQRPYGGEVSENRSSTGFRGLWRALEEPAPGPFAATGRRLLASLATAHGLMSFALITLGVLVTKFNRAAAIVHPAIYQQINHCGVRLLPVGLFIAGALGLVVVGQTVALLSRVGAQDLIGTVMVTAVVRELGPLTAAMLVLVRSGASTVIELGNARAQGEVETLEALCIDPIHYQVVPRVVGMMCAVFGLTIYLVVGALASGYLVAFLQDVPLAPGDYIRQIAVSLHWLDFLLLITKTTGFGLVIAVTACYHGLARPLTLQDVSNATIRAVVQSLVGCVFLDALFILVYLLM